MQTTDHSAEIAELRRSAIADPDRLGFLAKAAAAALLQCHDETGISLDQWPDVRDFVEYLIGVDVQRNGC